MATKIVSPRYLRRVDTRCTSASQKMMDRVNRFLTSPRRGGKCVIFVFGEKILTEEEKKHGFFFLGKKHDLLPPREEGITFANEFDGISLARKKKFVETFYKQLNDLANEGKVAIHNGDILRVTSIGYIDYIFIDGSLIISDNVSSHQAISISWPKFPIDYWEFARLYYLWVDTRDQRLQVIRHYLISIHPDHKNSASVRILGANNDEIQVNCHKDAIDSVVSELENRDIPIKFRTRTGGVTFSLNNRRFDVLDEIDIIFRYHYKPYARLENGSWSLSRTGCSSAKKRCNCDFVNKIPPHIIVTLDTNRVCDGMRSLVESTKSKYFRELFDILWDFYRSKDIARMIVGYSNDTA